MAKCKNCKHRGGLNHVYDECINHEMFEKKVVTNADRIRSMTDEELAKFLEAITCETHGWCDECKSLKGEYCHGLNDESNSLVQERLKWLKSEEGCE